MRFSGEQCKQCPFRRTSAPGWLGNYTPASVVSSIWKGFPFFCHTKINYESKTWQARAMKNGTLCAGGLAFANLLKVPRSAHAAIEKGREQIRCIEVECMTVREFVAHHSRSEDGDGSD